MKLNKFELFFYIVIVILILLLVAAARGQETAEPSLSGGQFSISKTVVAGGGSADLQQYQVSAGNTVGQAVAGRQSSGGNFTLYTGFWTPDNFAPTAATATVGGRITTADGRGIRNVRVTITFPNGQTQAALSASFGYYRFTEIPVGATYVVSVAAKRFVFKQSTQICTILDDAQDIDFIAEDLPSGEQKPTLPVDF